MPASQSEISRIKKALTELHATRSHFSTPSFGLLALGLLQRLRVAQTTTRDTSQTSDEIRLVTVMFVDVIDSTQLSQQIDTSDWKTVISRAHSRVAELVNQWGGEVGQYLGDGLLAFFGAQHSAGDDAIRAVSAALAIRNRIEQFKREIKRDYDIPFGIRIGISTGRVVVGIVGSEVKQELLAMGPSTTLAARLQTLASEGEIYVDTTTWSRARAAFEFTAKPPVALKGFDTPIKYYVFKERRVMHTAELTSSQVNGIDIPFVARTVELETISNLQDRALSEQAFHALTISGDIGTGKSRLLQRVVELSADLPFTPLVMVASYERRNSSNNLLRDLLMRQTGITEDSSKPDMQAAIVSYITDTWNTAEGRIAAEVIGYLAGFGFEDRPSVQPLLTGDFARDQAGFTWVARWLRQLASQKALLLVVDNLQWADNASTELLSFLSQQLDTSPVLLISAGRPVIRTVHVSFMRSLKNHQALALKPLEREDTLDMVEHVLSYVDKAPRALFDLIDERAEGNPLFVQEFLNMLFDNGVFEPDGEQRWRFNIIQYDTAISDLPGGLIGVLQARLDDLTPDARHIIQLGAICGQVFWDGALRAMSPDRDPAPLLEMLISRGMIARVPESTFEDTQQYTFTHTLYRDVAYEMLPRAVREKYHQAVAHWLLVRVHTRPAYIGFMADQFEQAGMHEVALYIYLEGTYDRIARGLFSEALTMIDRGLAQARNVTRETALLVVSQLWTERAQALNALLRYEEAGAASQSALMLLDELPPNSLVHTRAQAARVLGVSFRSQGRYQDAFNALNQAYEILPENDTAQLASLLRTFGSLSLYQGRLEEALAYQQRAHDLAQKTGQTSQINHTMTQLGLIALDRGHMGEALSYFEQVLESNENLGYAHFIALDMRNIALVYWTLGAFNRATVVLQSAYETQRSIGIEDTLMQAFRGMIHILNDENEEGLALLEDAYQRGHRDIHDSRIIHLTYIRALYRLKMYAACREQAQEFINRVAHHNLILQARGRMMLAMARFAQGDSGVMPLMEQALADEERYGGRDLWRGHLFMSQIAPDEETRDHHRAEAVKIVEKIAEDLTGYPELRQSFLTNGPVAALRPAEDIPASS